MLTYNECGFETESVADTQKRAAVLLLLRRLRQRNVPIDAVGIQSHLTATAGAPGSGLQRFLTSCRDLDLQVFVTEMDVDDRGLPANTELRDRGSAAAYSGYLDAVLPHVNVRAVLTAGLDDGQSTLDRTHPREDGRSQRPLLFDRDLHAKPALAAVTAAFRDRPPLAAPQR